MAAAAVSALVAAAPREPVVLVPARLLVLAHLPVPAQRPREADLPAPAQLPEAPVVPAPVVAHLVVDSALLLDLLNRRLFSAATARSSP